MKSVKHMLPVGVLLLATLLAPTVGWSADKVPEKGIGYTALDVGLGTPLSIPWGQGWDVFGLEVNLAYSECRFLRGVELAAVASAATVDARGVQVAVGFTYSQRELWGWQLALGVNSAETVYGLQTAVGGNITKALHGAQIGLVNYAETCPGGFQIGILNFIMDNQIPLIPLFNCYF